MTTTFAEMVKKISERQEGWWINSPGAGRVLCMLAQGARSFEDLDQEVSWVFDGDEGMKSGERDKALNGMIHDGLICEVRENFTLNMAKLPAMFLEIAMREHPSYADKKESLYEDPFGMGKKYDAVHAWEVMEHIASNGLFRDILLEYLSSIEREYIGKTEWDITPADLAEIFEWVLITRSDRLVRGSAGKDGQLASLFGEWRDMRLSSRKFHENVLEAVLVKNGMLHN